jgi:hypothetical protein
MSLSPSRSQVIRRLSSSDLPTSQVPQAWQTKLQVYGAVGLLFVVDKLLSYACHWYGIGFPSALIGAAFIVGGLLLCSHHNQALLATVLDFMTPGVNWVSHKWLGLFYSPALITLPLACEPLTGESARGPAMMCAARGPAMMCAAAWAKQTLSCVHTCTCVLSQEPSLHLAGHISSPLLQASSCSKL